MPFLIINSVFLVSLFRRKTLSDVKIIVYQLLFLTIQFLFVSAYFGFIVYSLMLPFHSLILCLGVSDKTTFVVNAIIFTVFPVILYLVFRSLLLSSTKENKT
ncbi:hypothetical protein ES708_15550 [subsurface metagenome]